MIRIAFVLCMVLLSTDAARAQQRLDSASDLIAAIAAGERGTPVVVRVIELRDSPNSLTADSVVDGLIGILGTSQNRHVRDLAIFFLSSFSESGHRSAGDWLMDASVPFDDKDRATLAHVADRLRPVNRARDWLLNAARDSARDSEAPERAIWTLQRMGPTGHAALRLLMQNPRQVRNSTAAGVLLRLAENNFQWKGPTP